METPGGADVGWVWSPVPSSSLGTLNLSNVVPWMGDRFCWCCQKKLVLEVSGQCQVRTHRLYSAGVHLR